MVGTIKQDRRIKIWSCFSYNGVGEFYWIKDKLDADKYHYTVMDKKNATPFGTFFDIIISL